MNITVSVDVNNIESLNFQEIERFSYETALSVGREFLKRILEAADLEIMASRDSERYRSKGKRKTCIKTKVGPVEYYRRVYVDETATEGTRCVYLLDQALGVATIGHVSHELCKLISTSVCESSYRSVARQVTDLTGLPISHQGAWNIVQSIGESQEKLIERYTELAQANKGRGEISTKILYEENDGVCLNLQRREREDNHSSKEMKIGIAYDGVEIQKTKNGNVRRKLDNKLAYASFESSNSFKQHKEGIVANHFNVDEISLRVINGDGAGWVQNFGKAENTIVTLDAFHRNQALKKYVFNKDFQKTLSKELAARNYDVVIQCIAAQIDSTDDEEEKEALRKLLSYYENNKEALPGYFERGIDIPETRKPEEIHHAKTGSMESNVFTIIANRMKGKRRCWSIRGANNLAKILCAYNTIGLEYLFDEIPDLPHEENEALTPEELELINAPIPNIRNKNDGSGYELPGNVSTTNSPYPIVRNLSNLINFTDLNFHC